MGLWATLHPTVGSHVGLWGLPTYRNTGVNVPLQYCEPRALTLSRDATITLFLWGAGKCTTFKTTLPPRVRSYKRLQELAIEGKGKGQGALALLYAMSLVLFR